MQAREPVESGEDRFRELAQAMPAMVWTATPDGTINWHNDGPLQRAASGWLASIHPEDVEATLAQWSRSCAAGTAFESEVRLRGDDGAFRWHLARAAPTCDADGVILRWVGVNTDIDRQKVAADSLERDNDQLEQDIFRRLHEVQSTQSRLQAYFDACPDYLFLMRLSKADGLVYEDLNPAAERLFDLAREAIIGRPLGDVVDAEMAASIDRHAREVLRRGETINYQVERKYGAAPAVLIQVVGAPIDYSNEEEGLVLFCGRDITEQRAVEEALRQSQKMEAVGQLTGGLAHDFNNLLTGITGSLDLLRLRLSQGRFDKVDRYVDAAQSAAERAAALTHRLLAFSRRQTLDPKPTDPALLVAGMEDLLRRTVGPEIRLDVQSVEDAWTLLVDPSQLENALLNLCINARDAMPDGGRITIAIQNTHLEENDVREPDLPPGDYVSVGVTDTGTGMAPHIMKRVFDPFFTTKPIGMGTGLGLSMIYGFACQSGGQVKARSTLGVGTTMRLLLPRHHGPADMKPVLGDLSSAPRAEGGETVLIVDDEPTVRMLVSEVLKDLGYRALEAVDGTAGLKHLQSSRRIDLLVTDVGLPGGMNGRQVAEAGRSIRPGLKVLFITGYAENAVLNHGHLGTGMQIMTKPFAMESLASRIKLMIDETAAIV